MEKTKSILEIADQVNRLVHKAKWRNGNNGDFNKYEKDPYFQAIFKISDRYCKNIQKTDEWKKAFEDAYDFDYCDPTMESVRFEIRDSRAKTAGYGSADHVKVPRSIYAA